MAAADEFREPSQSLIDAPSPGLGRWPELRRASKFLSLILRHDPSAAGLVLDGQGWVDIGALLVGMAAAGTSLTREELEQIVASDAKSRYNIDGNRIRANQGHSLSVDLGLVPLTPPAVLFHGTARRFLDSILEWGLRPGQRQYVHLSSDLNTAVTVGRRHGKPVVLTVDTTRLHAEGYLFFLSENGVWLTASVAPTYLAIEPGATGL
jgi:putative RNA 2'-phosphotransferase